MHTLWSSANASSSIVDGVESLLLLILPQRTIQFHCCGFFFSSFAKIITLFAAYDECKILLYADREYICRLSRSYLAERVGSPNVDAGGRDGTTSEESFTQHTHTFTVPLLWNHNKINSNSIRLFQDERIARKSTRIEFNFVPIFFAIVLTYNIDLYSVGRLYRENRDGFFFSIILNFSR